MKLSERFSRFWLGGLAGDLLTLDHIPIGGSGDWREAKMKEVADRSGLVFKCGPDFVPRLVTVNGVDVTLRPGEKPKASVTPITRARKS